MSGRLLKGVFHPSLATCHTKLPNPYRPTNRSGYGLRWRLSLDQDPTTPTAQVGPGWGTQVHAMRPQFRTEGKQLGPCPKAEVDPTAPGGGGELKGVFHPSLAPLSRDAMKNGKSRRSGRKEERQQRARGTDKPAAQRGGAPAGSSVPVALADSHL